MSDSDDLLTTELKKLPSKPADSAGQPEKKRYSELMSAAAARAFAEALRHKGLKSTLPLLSAANTTPCVGTEASNDNGEDTV